VVGASVAEFDFGTHGGKKFARGFDVTHLRDILENDGLVGEQGRCHAGERGVLGSARADRA
jgi:hypothetical protein